MWSRDHILIIRYYAQFQLRFSVHKHSAGTGLGRGDGSFGPGGPRGRFGPGGLQGRFTSARVGPQGRFASARAGRGDGSFGPGGQWGRFLRPRRAAGTVPSAQAGHRGGLCEPGNRQQGWFLRHNIIQGDSSFSPPGSQPDRLKKPSPSSQMGQRNRPLHLRWAKGTVPMSIS